MSSLTRNDDRYEITARIGLGPAGHLYDALDRADNFRAVTIGELKKSDFNPKWFHKLTSRDLSPRYSIPGLISPVRYAISSDSSFGAPVPRCYYMVMERLGGTTLATICGEEKQTFEALEALKILHSIATLLASFNKENGPFKHLHVNLVALLPDRTVRLIDPIFLRYYYEEASNAVHEGRSIAHSSFSPPEYWRTGGYQSADVRSDIWALGVLAYAICYARLPFIGVTFLNQIEQIVSAPLLFPWDLGLSYIQHFITFCMNKNPDERFQNMEEVVTVLETLIKWNEGKDTREELGKGARDFEVSDPGRRFLRECGLFESPTIGDFIGQVISKAKSLNRKAA